MSTLRKAPLIGDYRSGGHAGGRSLPTHGRRGALHTNNSVVLVLDFGALIVPRCRSTSRPRTCSKMDERTVPVAMAPLTQAQASRQPEATLRNAADRKDVSLVHGTAELIGPPLGGFARRPRGIARGLLPARLSHHLRLLRLTHMASCAAEALHRSLAPRVRQIP
jgi:hypothetical protein